MFQCGRRHTDRDKTASNVLGTFDAKIDQTGD